jgi:hypothetical protein
VAATSEDLEATAHVYYLMPGIAQHVCVGDGGELFQDVMGDTSVAHLAEHVAIELMALTNASHQVACGRTRLVPATEESLDDAAVAEGRAYEIELSCADDVLVSSAFSSALWILSWAFGGAEDPAPSVEGIVEGMISLVEAANVEAPDPEHPHEAVTFAPRASVAEKGDEVAEEAAEAEAELAEDAVEAAEAPEALEAEAVAAELEDAAEGDEAQDEAFLGSESEGEEPAEHVVLGDEVGFIASDSTE